MEWRLVFSLCGLARFIFEINISYALQCLRTIVLDAGLFSYHFHPITKFNWTTPIPST